MTKINLSYNLERQYGLLERKKAAIKEKQRVMLTARKMGENPDLAPFDENIQNFENQLEALEREYSTGKSRDFVGWALISFEDEATKLALLKKYGLSNKIRIFIYLGLLPSRFSGGLIYKDSGVLYLEPAPEPSDIYWENLQFNTNEKIKRRLEAMFIELMLLVGCGAAIYGLNYVQYQVREDGEHKKSDEGREASNTRIQIISFLISLLINIINYLLAYLVRKLAK